MTVKSLPHTILLSEGTTASITLGTTVVPKGLSASAFEKLWLLGYRGEGVVIAVIDSGIDASHPDLQQSVIKRIDLTNSATYNGYHGTHVAGIIVANGKVIGGANAAKLIDIQILDSNGTGTVDDLVTAIQLAVISGANIINMSLGTATVSQNDLARLNAVIAYAWASGVMCIAAAGNDGVVIGTAVPYDYPAAITNTVAVAACQVADNLVDVQIATFSSENDKISLGACGVDVLSCLPDNKYGILSGTSMAVPAVSALAALLREMLVKQQPTIAGIAITTQLLVLLNSNTSPIAPSLEVGKGFIRYQPNTGAYIPSTQKFYYNNIFLGNQLT